MGGGEREMGIKMGFCVLIVWNEEGSVEKGVKVATVFSEKEQRGKGWLGHGA